MGTGLTRRRGTDASAAGTLSSSGLDTGAGTVRHSGRCDGQSKAEGKDCEDGSDELDCSSQGTSHILNMSLLSTIPHLLPVQSVVLVPSCATTASA